MSEDLNTKSLWDWVVKSNHLHPKAKIHPPSTRGVNWRSEAPQGSEYEWKWDSRSNKWIPYHNYAIQAAEQKYMKSLMTLRREYGDDLSGDGADDANRAAEKAENKVAEVNRENQEANAWLHENYNGASFYVTDTRTAPNMNQYLSSLSDDQLKQGIQYWQRQELTRHTQKVAMGDKSIDVHYNTGDAVLIHHETNYNDPNNLVYQFVNSPRNARSYNGQQLTTHCLYDDDNDMSDDQLQQMNLFGEQWNAHMSNQEHIRAEMNEATQQGNYDWLNSQYKLAKQQTNSIELNWSNYMKSLHNKRLSKDLQQLFTSGKRQLHHLYYLDHTYYDRDEWRLKAFQNYLPIRHQDEIDASIIAQIQNNNRNNLTSIYRADRKTDQVIGFVENTPSESTDMNMATEPVDAGMPQTNYAQTNQIQLTDTGDLYDRPLVFNPLHDDSEGEQHPISRGDAYNVLRNWEMHSVELVISGFTHWGHVLIQSIGKQPEATGTGNALQISMTIQYVRLAHIMWGKKPQTAASKGRNHASSRSVRVRPGQTVWGIAKGNGSEMRAIKHANPQIKNINLIYPGEKLVIPK